MELKQHFEQVMGTSVNMALATCVNGKPNVRTVTFGYDKEHEGRVFFSTFRGNQKTIEFAQNPNVACLPLPATAESDSQVRIFGKVQKSDMRLEQLIDLITPKYPDGANTLKMGGEMMEIYEVCFTEAFVTVCMAEAQSIKF
jgi:uncharacterized pyridoxamine 5'-phosphate oxidase family protein